MIENIAKFFDGDIVKIITGVSAILALIFSAVNFVYNYMANRKHVVFHFSKITSIDRVTSSTGEKFGLVKLHFIVENKSQLPIAITRIRICKGDKSYDCALHEVSCGSYTLGEKAVTIPTLVLPIHLNCLAAKSGYLAFPVPLNTISIDDKDLTFEISTTRGEVHRILHEPHEESIAFLF